MDLTEDLERCFGAEREQVASMRRTLRLSDASRHRAPTIAMNGKPAGTAAPRERRDRRAASPSRAGPKSSDESESSEPPQPGRRCENARCEADLSHLHVSRRFCSNACRQAAYRDRQTLEQLDELVGTVAERLSCSCFPKRHLVDGGVCFSCGKPRGAVTRGWLEHEAVAA